MIRVWKFRFLVTSLGFLPEKTERVNEDNAAVVTSITANKITPRLRHIDLVLSSLFQEHTKEGFQAVQTLSRIQISNMGTKPESRQSIMRSASITMSHTHIQAISVEHCAELIKPSLISLYKHYSHHHSTDKTGQILKILQTNAF